MRRGFPCRARLSSTARCRCASSLPAARDFYTELRRLTALAGLTVRTLEKATSARRSHQAHPYKPGRFLRHKSSWQRWLRAEGRYPPRKAIKILTERLAEEQIPASRLLELWDRAFAPAEPNAQPAQTAPPGQAASRVAACGPAAARGGPADGTGGQLDGARGRSPGRPGGQGMCRRADRQDVQGTGIPGGGLAASRGTRPRPVGIAASAGRGDHRHPPARPPPPARPVARGTRPGRVGYIITLALLLMESLLAGRNTADPVPVLLPAASLAPGEMVRSWIARTLADRYPSLRDAQASGPGAPGDLVALGKVLPVIDGLDDLEPQPRAALLDALQRALGRDQPLVVTCSPARNITRPWPRSTGPRRT